MVLKAKLDDIIISLVGVASLKFLGAAWAGVDIEWLFWTKDSWSSFGIQEANLGFFVLVW